MFHMVLRMYLQESMGCAVRKALENHFEIPTDDFAELYNARVSELQTSFFPFPEFAQPEISKRILIGIDNERNLALPGAGKV